jgi:hypothetical protein
MKIKKQIFQAFAILGFCLLAFGCKKGPEDPSLSLRSRKARISGDWKLKSGNIGITYNDAAAKSAESDDYELTPSGCTIYETPTSKILTVYLMAYSLQVKILPDGTFTLDEQAGVDHLTANGKWNFTGAVGDAKKKDGVYFKIEHVDKGTTDKHLFNRFRSEFEFYITELRNKEMKLKISVKTFMDAAGSYISHSGELTLVQ